MSSIFYQEGKEKMKHLMVVGLPASGKSTFLQTITGSSDIILDDFVTPDQVREALKTGERIILSDPMFCLDTIRNAVIKLFKEESPIELEIIYFENNKEKALKNASLRPFKKVDRLIENLSKEYRPERVDKLIWQTK